MTPSTYARGGTGMAIASAVVRSPLGPMLVAVSRRGVCAVRFGSSRAALERWLREEFPAALRGPATARLRAAVQAALAATAGHAPDAALPLDVRATAFQRQVWQALRAIPPGETRTYGEIARAIGRPRAARAVGAACGANPVAVLVPCHRAVRGDGGLGGYAYGVARKRTLLAREKKA
jgi:AraC family transcriptional regulator of adaptative response/methylated-DNA-[protein]-cysteine methyltransferase